MTTTLTNATASLILIPGRKGCLSIYRLVHTKKNVPKAQGNTYSKAFHQAQGKDLFERIYRMCVTVCEIKEIGFQLPISNLKGLFWSHT